MEFDAGGSVSINTPTDLFSVNASDIILDASGGSLIMRAKSFSRQIQTSKNTDEVSGDSTLKVGGEYKCRAGSMQLSGRGQVGISSGMGFNLAAATGGSITAGLGLELIGVLPNTSGNFVNITGGLPGKLQPGSIQIGALPPSLKINGPAVGGVPICSIELGMQGITMTYGLGAAAQTITMNLGGITVDSKTNLSLSALGNASLSSVLNASVEGTVNASLKGTVNASVEGSAIATVKGGVLMLN